MKNADRVREAGRRMRTFEAMARVAIDQVIAIDFALQRLPGEDERDFKLMPTYVKNAIRDARKAVAFARKLDGES